VTRRVDGRPHRVLRSDLVERLERAGRWRGLAHAVVNANRFRRETGLSWPSMVREGMRMRHGDLDWAQVLMAANTPMLLRAGLVDGDPRAGVLAAGQVVGLLSDLPECAELITRMVADAVAILRRVNGLAVDGVAT